MQEQHVQNLAKMGEIPGRPACDPWKFRLNFGQSVHESKCKLVQYCSVQHTQTKTERLEPRMIGPTYNTPTQPQARNRLWEEYATIDQQDGGSEGREGTSPGRPAP